MFARYILPVLPFLCVTAAWFVVALVRVWLASRPPRVQGLAIALVALLAVAPTAAASIQLDRLLAVTDNRVVTADALANVLPADDLVYQSGSSYGRVPLGLDGRGAALREARIRDDDTGTFEPAEPSLGAGAALPFDSCPARYRFTRARAGDRYTLVSTHAVESVAGAVRVDPSRTPSTCRCPVSTDCDDLVPLSSSTIGGQRRGRPGVGRVGLVGRAGRRASDPDKCAKQNHRASQVKKAGEVGGASFVPSDQATRVLEPGKQSFDAPPTSIASQRPAVLRDVDAIAPMWGDQLDPAVRQFAVEAVAVIGRVADQAERIVGQEAGV